MSNPCSTNEMKAMILAAGLGSRMRPLTDTKPKALLEVNGVTLLERAIRHLQSAGISRMIINVHHFSDQIMNFLKEKNYFGCDITISDEHDQLLDTGGGLKKAAFFLNDDRPFIVRNVDLLSDLDFQKVIDFHYLNSAIATLVVRKRETSRYFLADQTGQLVGWKNTATREEILVREPSGLTGKYGFSGIQVLDSRIFSLINEEGKFSLTSLYLRLARDHKIVCYDDKDSNWKDVGKSILDLQE